MRKNVFMPEIKSLNTQAGISQKLGPMGEEFAVATTDVAFKQMLSLKINNDKSVMLSFLNSFVPNFENDPVNDVTEEMSTTIPASKRKASVKKTFMDLHVATRSGEHYIIEMQALRHKNFDERAMYYASQLNEKELQETKWYSLLRPTIAIQVLDYDTNKIRGKLPGTKEDEDSKKTLQQVRQYPLAEGQYTKNFMMTCQNSGQKIDSLRMLQIELPLSNAVFPPQASFTEKQWWLSVLRFSEKCTHKQIDELENKGVNIPTLIKTVFSRLDYSIRAPKLQV